VSHPRSSLIVCPLYRHAHKECVLTEWASSVLICPHVIAVKGLGIRGTKTTHEARMSFPLAVLFSFSVLIFAV
jgi:hypothetical protein